MNIESPQNNTPFREYPSWIKSPLDKENGELLRAAETFYDKDFLRENHQAFFGVILENYKNTESQGLSDEIWSQLQNSDSWPIQTNDYKKIETLIGDKRNWKGLKLAFEQQAPMEMPIIAHLPDGTYHLLSGNTRLCLAKASAIRPEVVVLEFPEVPESFLD